MKKYSVTVERRNPISDELVTSDFMGVGANTVTGIVADAIEDHEDESHLEHLTHITITPTTFTSG